MRAALCGLIILLLSDCGSAPAAATAKNLFSVWTSMTNGAVMDFSKASFGTDVSMTFVFATGAKCTCTLNVIGTQSAGNYVFSACGYTSGGTGDPGCSALNSSGSYTNVSNVLSACSGGVCSSYK